MWRGLLFFASFLLATSAYSGQKPLSFDYQLVKAFKAKSGHVILDFSRKVPLKGGEVFQSWRDIMYVGKGKTFYPVILYPSDALINDIPKYFNGTVDYGDPRQPKIPGAQHSPSPQLELSNNRITVKAEYYIGNKKFTSSYVDYDAVNFSELNTLKQELSSHQIELANAPAATMLYDVFKIEGEVIVVTGRKYAESLRTVIPTSIPGDVVLTLYAYGMGQSQLVERIYKGVPGKLKELRIFERIKWYGCGGDSFTLEGGLELYTGPACIDDGYPPEFPRLVAKGFWGSHETRIERIKNPEDGSAEMMALGIPEVIGGNRLKELPVSPLSAKFGDPSQESVWYKLRNLK